MRSSRSPRSKRRSRQARGPADGLSAQAVAFGRRTRGDSIPSPPNHLYVTARSTGYRSTSLGSMAPPPLVRRSAARRREAARTERQARRLHGPRSDRGLAPDRRASRGTDGRAAASAYGSDGDRAACRRSQRCEARAHEAPVRVHVSSRVHGRARLALRGDMDDAAPLLRRWRSTTGSPVAASARAEARWRFHHARRATEVSLRAHDRRRAPLLGGRRYDRRGWQPERGQLTVAVPARLLCIGPPDPSRLRPPRTRLDRGR